MYVYVHMYKCIYMWIHVYIYICIYIYISIHVYSAKTVTFDAVFGRPSPKKNVLECCTAVSKSFDQVFCQIFRCRQMLLYLTLAYTDHVARKKTPHKHHKRLWSDGSAWDSDVDMSSCCTGYPHWEPRSIPLAIMFPDQKATKWGGILKQTPLKGAILA